MLVEEQNIPTNIKHAVLSEELALWTATRYKLRIQYKVRESIGADGGILAGLLKEMEQVEQAIELVTAELEGISDEAATVLSLQATDTLDEPQ